MNRRTALLSSLFLGGLVPPSLLESRWKPPTEIKTLLIFRFRLEARKTNGNPLLPEKFLTRTATFWSPRLFGEASTPRQTPTTALPI